MLHVHNYYSVLAYASVSSEETYSEFSKDSERLSGSFTEMYGDTTTDPSRPSLIRDWRIPTEAHREMKPRLRTHKKIDKLVGGFCRTRLF